MLVNWEPWTPFCLSSCDAGLIDLPVAPRDDVEDLARDVAFKGSDGIELGMPLAEAFGLHDVCLASRPNLVVQQFAQRFQRQVLFVEMPNLFQERIGKDRDVGRRNAGRAENVNDLRRNDRTVQDLLDCEITIRVAGNTCSRGRRLIDRLGMSAY